MKSIKIKARLMGGEGRMEEVIVNINYIVLFKPSTGHLIMSGIATDDSMNAYEVEEADRNRLATAL